jgi:hypothetical protein
VRAALDLCSSRKKRPINNIIKKINDMYGGDETIGTLFGKTVGGMT